MRELCMMEVGYVSGGQDKPSPPSNPPSGGQSGGGKPNDGGKPNQDIPDPHDGLKAMEGVCDTIGSLPYGSVFEPICDAAVEAGKSIADKIDKHKDEVEKETGIKY